MHYFGGDYAKLTELIFTEDNSRRSDLERSMRYEQENFTMQTNLPVLRLRQT
jgi:hypothetical protein